MKKLLSLAAGLTLFAGVASAAPVTLSEEAMDSVTAGSYSNTAYGQSTGFALALGYRNTLAEVIVDSYAVTSEPGFFTPGSSEAGAYSSSYASSYPN